MIIGNSPNENESSTSQRRSPWCLVLAALLVLAFAKQNHAQTISPPPPLPTLPALNDALLNEGFNIAPTEQLDDITVIPNEAGSESNEPEVPLAADRRIVSAHAEAWLANFDADRHADGWKIRLALFNEDDQLVSVRGHITVTLAPNLIDQTGRGFRATDLPIQRWSKPLAFDKNGLMTVRLPASPSIRRALEAQNDSRDQNGFVPSASLPLVGATPRDIYAQSVRSRNWLNQTNWSYRNRYPSRFDRRPSNGWSTDSRYDDRVPPYGHVSIRVSVPGQGVFNTATDVRIRPSIRVHERDYLQP